MNSYLCVAVARNNRSNAAAPERLDGGLTRGWAWVNPQGGKDLECSANKNKKQNELPLGSQSHSRISSLCVCARVPCVYEPFVAVARGHRGYAAAPECLHAPRMGLNEKRRGESKTLYQPRNRHRMP